MQMFIDGFGDVEILEHLWWSIPNYANHIGGNRNTYQIGRVTIRNSFGEEKTYIGITSDYDSEPDLERDIKTIVMAGVPYLLEK